MRHLTSNRAVEELPALFGDPLLASAAMDRLLRSSHVVTLDGVVRPRISSPEPLTGALTA